MPECNTEISQDAKTIAAIPGVRNIRPSSYYKAPKSAFEYLIKFCIFTHSPQRPVQMQILENLNDSSTSVPVGTGSILAMIVSPDWLQPCLF